MAGRSPPPPAGSARHHPGRPGPWRYRPPRAPHRRCAPTPTSSATPTRSRKPRIRRAATIGGRTRCRSTSGCCTVSATASCGMVDPVHVDGTAEEGIVIGFEVVDLSGHAPGLIGLLALTRPGRARLRLLLHDRHARQAPTARRAARRLQPRHRAGQALDRQARRDAACHGAARPPRALTGPDVVAQLEAAAA